MTRRPWHEQEPNLVAEIRKDLERYPNLHLFIGRHGNPEVRGTFPVRGADGQELDSFQVRIELPPGYPEDLPVVREVGGRLPWKEESHVNAEGTASPGVACVIIPDDRWRCFPVGARFLEYVEGPLHNYFLGQTRIAHGEPWPFDEWKHGPDGVLQYYQWLLKTDDVLTVWRFVYVLARFSLKRHWQCPCGSGRKIKRCCEGKINTLRRKIPSKRAVEVLELLRMTRSPYNGPQFR